MLPSIVHPSPPLCCFMEQLKLPLSEPQRRHLTNVADALLVCDTERTLAALHRQFIETVDPSNMADFFRISPWQADAVRERLQAFLVRWAIDQAPPDQPSPVIRISLDDSIAEKDKVTRHLEPVDWHYDHMWRARRGDPATRTG